MEEKDSDEAEVEAEVDIETESRDPNNDRSNKVGFLSSTVMLFGPGRPLLSTLLRCPLAFTTVSRCHCHFELWRGQQFLV